MMQPRRMSREQRHANLLETAAAIVAQEGAGSLSFESLASAAGVAKSLPYAYFASPEEVLLALFDDVIGAVDAEIAGVVRAGGAFDAVLRSALDVWLDAARDHGRLLGALLDGRGVPGLQAAIARRDRASLQLWRGVVVDRFEVDDVDALVLAAMLTSTATAVVELWVRKKAPRPALADSFVAAARAAAEARTPISRRRRSREDDPSSPPRAHRDRPSGIGPSSADRWPPGRCR